MTTLSVNIDLSDLKKLPDNYKAGLEKGMRLAMIFAEGQSKRLFNTPGNLQVNTGRLRASIIGTTRSVGNSYTGILGSNVIYSSIHELGGTIKPKAAKHLRFKTSDGAWHTKSSVTIPARPYLSPSFRGNNLDRIRNIIIDSAVKDSNK